MASEKFMSENNFQYFWDKLEAQLATKVSTDDERLTLATASKNGLFSSADFTKLSGIEAGLVISIFHRVAHLGRSSDGPAKALRYGETMSIRHTKISLEPLHLQLVLLVWYLHLLLVIKQNSCVEMVLGKPLRIPIPHTKLLHPLKTVLCQLLTKQSWIVFSQTLQTQTALFSLMPSLTFPWVVVEQILCMHVLFTTIPLNL